MTVIPYQSVDWYDLPRYYDIVFEADTHNEADFLEQISDRWGRGAQRVLEPGCGSGRLIAEMARRGHAVTGFDANPHMLAFARERLDRRRLTATLFPARLEQFRVRQPVDLAHCLVSTFKYLLEEESARSHLRCVAQALRPGGLYVVGLHLSEYGYPHRIRERWVGRRGATEVVCNIQQWPPDRRRRRERVRSRLTVRERGLRRQFETTWWFRCYSARQLVTLLRSIPDLEHVATYDFTYAPDRPMRLDGGHLDVVVVLRKRDFRGSSRR